MTCFSNQIFHSIRALTLIWIHLSLTLITIFPAWRSSCNWTVSRWPPNSPSNCYVPFNNILPVQRQDGVKCRWVAVCGRQVNGVTDGSFYMTIPIPFNLDSTALPGGDQPPTFQPTFLYSLKWKLPSRRQISGCWGPQEEHQLLNKVQSFGCRQWLFGVTFR